MRTDSKVSPVVLITGATSGIGAATALAFGRAGWRVALAGRRAEQGDAVAKQIRDLGAEALFVATDVTDRSALDRLVERTVKQFGRLDAAFNNAGVEGDVFVPTHEQRMENYTNVFDVNVRALLASMQAEIPAILKSGGGAIVNNASIAGLTGFGGMGVYAASKSAVVGLTRTAALDYATQGLRINAVAPGPIETDMYDRFATEEVKAAIRQRVPMGRAGTPAEIASAVLWLCDPTNTYTTGQIIAVDGGFTAA